MQGEVWVARDGSQHTLLCDLALNCLQSLVHLFPKGLFISHQYICLVLGLKFLCAVCVCVCIHTHYHISVSIAISHDLWLYLPRCAVPVGSVLWAFLGVQKQTKARGGRCF